MGYCPQCGAALAPAARYCGRCGSAVATSPALPPMPAPAGPAPVAAAAKDTGAAQALLLVGAVLGVLLPLAAALVFVMVGAVVSWIPFAGTFAAAAFAMVAVFFVLLSIGWALVVLHARKLVAQGRTHDGAVIAVIAGLVMLVVGMPFFLVPGLAGLLVLLGGVLAWSA